ncbi:MAG: hypothetical protein K6A23_03040 [Butyrivibrio sp.]|nr:hypothetical protein [Butyrivibrio sp.]
MNNEKKAIFHLPGLFEFYDFYSAFLPLYRNKRKYFYDYCEIGSVYGSPADCIWGGGRAGFGEEKAEKVVALMSQYGISSRLTFSNSLLDKEHLKDKKCNRLCELFENTGSVRNGIIIYSDLLLDYLRNKYPGFYYVSSTTKVLTDFKDFEKELNRSEFDFVVPDFRLNKDFENLKNLSKKQKEKVEFLCNECCYAGCNERKKCYENVSRKNLGTAFEEHICASPNAERGYRFSDAMENPMFIGIEDIEKYYISMGFNNFKIEGRSLGSAMILEFLLYYMTKPEFQLRVREEIYLDSSLDLF